MTIFESSRTLSFLTPKVLASFKLARSALYSIILFVTGNPILKAFGIVTHSGDKSTIPTPFPFWFKAPSKYVTHVLSFASRMSAHKISSSGKSVLTRSYRGRVTCVRWYVIACPFMDCHTDYVKFGQKHPWSDRLLKTVHQMIHSGQELNRMG